MEYKPFVEAHRNVNSMSDQHLYECLSSRSLSNSTKLGIGTGDLNRKILELKRLRESDTIRDESYLRSCIQLISSSTEHLEEVITPLMKSDSEIDRYIGLDILSTRSELNRGQKNDIVGFSNFDGPIESLYEGNALELPRRLLANRLRIHQNLELEEISIDRYGISLTEFLFNRDTEFLFNGDTELLFNRECDTLHPNQSLSLVEVLKTLTLLITLDSGSILTQRWSNKTLTIMKIIPLANDELMCSIYDCVAVMKLNNKNDTQILLHKEMIQSTKNDLKLVIDRYADCLAYKKDKFIETLLDLLHKEQISSLIRIRIVEKLIEKLWYRDNRLVDPVKWLKVSLPVWFRKTISYLHDLAQNDKSKDLLYAYLKAALYLENQISLKKHLESPTPQESDVNEESWIASISVKFINSGYDLILHLGNELSLEDIKLVVKYFAKFRTENRVIVATYILKRMTYFKIQHLHATMLNEYTSVFYMLCSYGIPDQDLEEIADCLLSNQIIILGLNNKMKKASQRFEVLTYSSLFDHIRSIQDSRAMFIPEMNRGEGIVSLLKDYSKLVFELNLKLPHKVLVTPRSSNRFEYNYSVLEQICQEYGISNYLHYIGQAYAFRLSSPDNSKIYLSECFNEDKLLEVLEILILEFGLEALIKIITSPPESPPLPETSVNFPITTPVVDFTEKPEAESDKNESRQALSRISSNFSEASDSYGNKTIVGMVDYLLNQSLPEVYRAYVFQLLRLMIFDPKVEYLQIYSNICNTINSQPINAFQEMNILKSVFETRALKEALNSLSVSSDALHNNLQEIDIENRVFFTYLDTKFGRALYGGYILINVNLLTQDFLSTSKAIITFVHELGHLVTRIADRGFDFLFYSPKRLNRVSTDKKNRENGEAIEKILFGSLVGTVNESQINYINQISNWGRSLDVFRAGFEECGRKEGERRFNLQHRHGDRVHIKDDFDCPYADRYVKGGFI